MPFISAAYSAGSKMTVLTGLFRTNQSAIEVIVGKTDGELMLSQYTA